MSVTCGWRNRVNINTVTSYYEPGHCYRRLTRVFLINNKYGGNTESCRCINFSNCQHCIMHSIKYCNAKFARRLYEEAHEYPSPSFVALNENSYCQTTRKEASERFLWMDTEHGISLKCQYILFDMSASQHSPPFVLFCIQEQRLVATQKVVRLAFLGF